MKKFSPEKIVSKVVLVFLINWHICTGVLATVTHSLPLSLTLLVIILEALSWNVYAYREVFFLPRSISHFLWRWWFDWATMCTFVWIQCLVVHCSFISNTLLGVESWSIRIEKYFSSAFHFSFPLAVVVWLSYNAHFCVFSEIFQIFQQYFTCQNKKFFKWNNFYFSDNLWWDDVPHFQHLPRRWNLEKYYNI